MVGCNIGGEKNKLDLGETTMPLDKCHHHDPLKDDIIAMMPERKCSAVSLLPRHLMFPILPYHMAQGIKNHSQKASTSLG